MSACGKALDSTEDLKQRAIRGGFAKLAGQVFSITFRFVGIAALARLLEPADFGLVGMVTTVTGVFELFRDGGLCAALIQQPHVTKEQQSTLFWINISIGVLLAFICVAAAPILVTLYNEPRLFWVTIVLASGFIISAAGAQHVAMLERQLRYQSLALIDSLGVFASTTLAIAMACAGFGYWSLVVSTLIMWAVYTAGAWITLRWTPGMPCRDANVLSMLRFGGRLTISKLVAYLGYNVDKVLLGRFWGADALGLYGRVSQLIGIPNSLLNSTVGGVAFSTLSRLQHDPQKYKIYFLKGYSLVIDAIAPVTIFAAMFAEEIIYVVLGPQWIEAAIIFKLLTPIILVLGIISPTGWLTLSLGLQKRSLAITLVRTPLCIAAYLIGLPYGPSGIALAFSVAMTFWLVPQILWSLKGTMISPYEFILTAWPALVSTGVAAAVAYFAHAYAAEAWAQPLWRLLFGGCVMGASYVFMLLFVMGKVMGKKSLFLAFLSQRLEVVPETRTG